MGVKTYQEVEEQPENPEVIVEDSLLTTVPEPTTIEISEQPDSATKISVVKDDPTAKVKKDEPELSPILTMLQKMGKMSDGKPMELSKGEVAVCLFSMTCGHCQESYKELCELSAFASLPKLYLINYGQEFEQKYFFNQAGNCRHAHVRTEDYTKFNRLLQGKGFPRILALKDGKIVQDWNIDTYSKDAFMKHFKIEETNKNAEDGLNLQKKDDGFDDFEKQPWE